MNHYRIEPGSDLNLSGRDARDKAAFPDLRKKTAPAMLHALTAELAELQHLLWADGSKSLLVVFQAMDTGGKDGTIRKVFSGVNPQGVDVYGFAQPGPHEVTHDYLWRIHARAPAKGRIGVFNRSHYEDVLVVRVNNLVPEAVWERRYDHIRNFETLLTDEGTVVVKIMLHISKDEQKDRLQARLDDPGKLFKFDTGDIAVRKQWDDYQLAYEQAIMKTSTVNAPWHVVPADRKWYRNLVVSQILIDTLKSMDLSYPVATFDPKTIVID